MIEGLAHLLDELGELARMSSAHRLDLERTLQRAPEQGGIPLKTIIEWSSTIQSIASRGMTECALTLDYPNPERLPLHEMKQVIQKQVLNLLDGTALKVMQFSGWEIRRLVPKTDSQDLNILPDISIEVRIGISWR